MDKLNFFAILLLGVALYVTTLSNAPEQVKLWVTPKSTRPNTVTYGEDGKKEMDGMTDDQRERVAAAWQALFATRYLGEDTVPCQIKKGFYLGSLGAARNKAALKSENVTHILTVASSLTPAFPSDFVYKIIGVLDNEDVDISKYFDECFNFIEEAIGTGGGVLVHCLAGRSRSVTIVVSYLMRKYSMSLAEALEYVREKRPVAYPNSGFMTLLQNYEKSLQEMDGMTDDQRERVAAAWQALFATRYLGEDTVPCQIKKGFYLGSLGAARNKAALKSENVTHILTVASSLTPAFPSDFVYKIIGVLDNEDVDISKYFDECFNFIEEAIGTGGGVLVHCLAGRSRSVTIVVSYLMRKYSMSLAEALEYVREKRPVAYPNSGFMTLLQNYEKSLQGKKFEHGQEV